MPLPLTCSSKPVAVREKNVKNVARDFSKCQEECPCKNRCLPYLQERLKAGSGELWAPVPHLHPWLRHREPGLFILMEKILRGPLLICINTWWGDLRKLRQTFFLWLSNDGTQEIPCKYKKKKKSLNVKRVKHWHRLLAQSPSLKLLQKLLSTVLGWQCFEKSLGIDNPERFLPPSIIRNSVKLHCRLLSFSGSSSCYELEKTKNCPAQYCVMTYGHPHLLNNF